MKLSAEVQQIVAAHMAKIAEKHQGQMSAPAGRSWIETKRLNEKLKSHGVRAVTTMLTQAGGTVACASMDFQAL